MKNLVARLVPGLALVAASLVGVAAPATAAPSAGINDWSCRPSAAHPEPVVLWHGLGSSGDVDMAYTANKLKAAGYCAFHTTYGTSWFGPWTGGLISMRTSAAQLKTFVAKVRTATGAAKVDIVGHSEGTTVPAYYLKALGGSADVKRFVGFGSNFAGTTLAGLQTLADLLHLRPVLELGGCVACNEFDPKSAFVRDLNAGGVTVPGTHYTSIVSKYDEIVTPYTSGLLAPAPNVTNIVLQDACPTDFSGHLGQAIDPNVAALVLNALDPANASPVSCVPLPWLS